MVFVSALIVLLVFISGAILGYVLHLFVGSSQRYTADHVVLNLPLNSNPSARWPQWMNIGLWEVEGTESQLGARSKAQGHPSQPHNAFIAASTRLADLIGAELVPGDRVLDVGFGCGDQIKRWLEQYNVGQVVGINPSGPQTQIAQQLLVAEISAQRVQLDRGSAPGFLKHYADSSFSAICSLDSAYHFKSREQFFREAKRILKPGGRLLLVDLVLSRSMYRNNNSLNFHSLHCRALAMAADIPWANLQTTAEYEHSLQLAGFTDNKIGVEPASAELVFKPLAAHIRQAIQTYRGILSPAVILKYKAAAALFGHIARYQLFAVVLVKAVKH